MINDVSQHFKPCGFSLAYSTFQATGKVTSNDLRLFHADDLVCKQKTASVRDLQFLKKTDFHLYQPCYVIPFIRIKYKAHEALLLLL